MRPINLNLKLWGSCHLYRSGVILAGFTHLNPPRCLYADVVALNHGGMLPNTVLLDKLSHSCILVLMKPVKL